MRLKEIIFLKKNFKYIFLVVILVTQVGIINTFAQTPEIYFCLSHNGDADIYRINIDGTGLTPIIQWSGTNESGPRISPDGTKLAFMSNLPGKHELYISNIDGTNAQRISYNTDNQGLYGDISWYPDGQYLIYAAIMNNGDVAIYKIKSDGTNRQILLDTPRGLHYHCDIDPMFGTHLAYIYDPGSWNPAATLFNYSLLDSTQIILVNGSLDKGKGTVRWAPNDQKLANSMRITGVSFPEDIYTFSNDGTLLTNITNGNSNDEFANPDYSPDGSKIVCVHGTPDNPYQIIKMNNDGTNRTLIFDTSGVTLGEPDWSNVYFCDTLLPVSISIVTTSTSICAGSSVTFTATSINRGSNPVFQWKVNGLNAGTNDSTFTYAPANNDQVKCILTSNIPCPSGNPDTSNTIIMTVNPLLSVISSITTPLNTVCQGDTITFTASVINGGVNPNYQWYVNRNPVSFPLTCNNLSNGLVACYPFNGNANDESGNGNNGIVYGATLTNDRFNNQNSAYLFNGLSNWIKVPQNSILEFGTSDFSVFAWVKKNNPKYCRVVSKGECFDAGWDLGQIGKIDISIQSPPNGPSYFQSNLNIYGDGNWHQIGFERENGIITIFGDGAVDGGPFAFPYSITNTNEDITIGRCRASNGSCYDAFFPGCIDDVRIYNRALTLAEIQQLYYNSANYYSYIPSNGDTVYCVVSSTDSCVSNNPDTSNRIIMTVNPVVQVSVTVSASINPICSGTSASFTAIPANGGTTPSYQWKVNGLNAGTNNSTYSYTPNNNDIVTCILTSDAPCVTGNPATSNSITMLISSVPIVNFAPCFDTITTVDASPIKLKGGIPLGGIYSGPGVNSSTGIFNPSAAGVGTKVITYTYTNSALCTASKNLHIIVQSAAVFTCGNPLNDIRDNNVYSTILIGSQCWLATNLNFGTFITSSQDQRDNCVAEKYCYNDNPINCNNQGGLYQWDELMQYDDTPADQGFCPPGWHIPTENDWNTLFVNYGNKAFAGSPLKNSGYSGFNALFLGARHVNSGWDFEGFATFFWSSTPYSGTQTWAHGLNVVDPSVSLYPSLRVNAFSVRCLKN